MTLYLDTSALVKAYIDETNSNTILAAMKQTQIVSSHAIAYVEAHATFSRTKRENKLSEKEWEAVKNTFNQDWQNYLRVENTSKLLQHAADLAEAFALRAYDSVHLASADLLAKQSKQTVIFACFDQKLNKAAHVLGLELLKA